MPAQAFVLTARRRRLLGIALIAYGLMGVLLLGAAGLVIGGAVQTLGTVSETASEQRDALVGALRATSRTVRDASTGVGNVGTSLRAAHRSADHAAGLARSLGDTLHELGGAMGAVQIFGARPLAGLASGFETAASQSDELATDLDDVASALGQNASDLDTSKGNLVALGARVELLVTAVEGTEFGGGGDPFVAQLILVALLGWLALPAAAGIAVGVTLLRS